VPYKNLPSEKFVELHYIISGHGFAIKELQICIERAFLIICHLSKKGGAASTAITDDWYLKTLFE
jgi:hypothetical protein